MDEEYIVIIPDYLDNPLNEEEEKEFFNDENLIDENQNFQEEEKENDWVSSDEFYKVYDAYMYEKSLNDYNAIVQEQNSKAENYLNQIANCSVYILGFVGIFVVFYLLSLIVKFFRSIIDF